MDISLITENAKLKTIIEDTKRDCKNKVFSDVVDGEGRQYVDLVMEGGGMLGIALVGYTYVLEEVGIRFLGLGGTSAGSINALLLATLGSPDQKKGEKLLELLAGVDFWDFVDGDSDARDFVRTWRAGAGMFKLTLKGVQVLDNVFEDLGLNPGSNFLEWIQKILRNAKIHNAGDLQNRMQSLPDSIGMREGFEPFSDINEMAGRLAIIAADVGTETKVEFPRMSPLYWEKPDEVDPALFARASISVPLFFEPLEINPLPRTKNYKKLWAELAGLICDKEDRQPYRALFVDGGIMSNFPIDVFHDNSRVPRLPTFGVKLELDRRVKTIRGPVGLLKEIFNSARHTLDYDFITRNPDYRMLVSWIPAKNFDWFDFSMSEKDKRDLFIAGALQAQKFLGSFDWFKYKQLRSTRIQSI